MGVEHLTHQLKHIYIHRYLGETVPARVRVRKHSWLNIERFGDRHAEPASPPIVDEGTRIPLVLCRSPQLIN